MNKFILLIGGILISTLSFAHTNTHSNLNNNWYCTTNASSATSDADKASDDKMAKNYSSANKSFEFAAQHCRDCTKITCESKK